MSLERASGRGKMMRDVATTLSFQLYLASRLAFTMVCCVTAPSKPRDNITHCLVLLLCTESGPGQATKRPRAHDSAISYSCADARGTFAVHN